MRRFDIRWQNSEVDDTRAEPFHKDQPTEISVSGQENTISLPSDFEQVRVVSAGAADFGCQRNIVPQITQKMRCGGPYILIKRKLHAATLTCKSSAASTSIA